ncbi:hypothetical protein J8273_8447 [Carpediemonas membranifera]|uniref:Uncharacterized protein n=1 Tax=Carpediemonas membranifera TaxID=201153 RepID=A0A8J6E6P1_9EUKA|nr:hypothetical protein J8273_8447 [Carpediemonas membranifera]|eukprot:KAG9389770.1 hypothetical protein J8273_8447 [Carpediemonas membranifera]
METVREFFILHSWSEKRNIGGFTGKMKPETIDRLDKIWSRAGEKKVADHVKECRRCGRYFSPGTSHQQLLTHARKCEVRHADGKRARLESGFTGAPVPVMARHHPPALVPQLVGLIDDHSMDPIQMRLNELSRKEMELHDMATKETPLSPTFNRALAFLKVVQIGITELLQQQHALMRVADPVQDKSSGVVTNQPFVVPPVIGSVLTSGHIQR